MCKVSFCFRHRSRISKATVFLVILSLLVFCNEWLFYVWKSFSWPMINCKDSKNCTVLLFVGDPQILGEIEDNVFLRFDNDRYLRNTFSLALNHVRPDGVIFLGDLMNEGSKATDEQFDRYCARFFAIFQLPQLATMCDVVFIPGDNDIGGEGLEVIEANNVNRFRSRFGKSDIANIRDVKVLKVNKLLRTYPVLEEDSNNKKLSIIVSHLPISKFTGNFNDKAIKELKARFIFSAHEHESYAILSDPNNDDTIEQLDLYYNEIMGSPSWVYRTDLHNTITEFVVPTCSYRMGSAIMGYSVAVYDPSKDRLYYHILWLPQRFVSLVVYAIFFLIYAIYLLKSGTHRPFSLPKFTRRSRTYSSY